MTAENEVPVTRDVMTLNAIKHADRQTGRQREAQTGARDQTHYEKRYDTSLRLRLVATTNCALLITAVNRLLLLPLLLNDAAIPTR